MFHFDTTQDEYIHIIFNLIYFRKLAEFSGILGQEKAQEHIKLALNMRSKGFHFYLVGDAGSGRRKIVDALLSSHVSSLPKQQLREHVLLYNVNQPGTQLNNTTHK